MLLQMLAAKRNGNLRSGRPHVLSLSLACVLGLALGLPGCGGGGVSIDTPLGPIPVVEPTRTTVLEETFEGLNPFDPTLGNVGVVSITIGDAADIDVTVDWTFPANDLDLFFYQGECALPELPSAACPELATAETLAKPETLSVSNLAAGTHTLIIVNLGTTPESGVIVIGATRSTSSAAVRSSNPEKDSLEVVQVSGFGLARALQDK